MVNRERRRGGWTLIELMASVAIIAVLATLITQALPFIQGLARDKRREGDMANLQRVIEIYKQDTGSYPTAATVTFSATTIP